MGQTGFILTPFCAPSSSRFSSSFTQVENKATAHYTRSISCARLPARMAAEEEEEGEEEGAMQGPTQAPTEKGVSTAGLGEQEAKFIEACYDSDVAVIESMLEEGGVDIGCTDVNRRTALHFCAGSGLPTVCEKLVEKGSEVNVQDILGFTPLHMATGYKMLDTVKMLVDAGADPNIESFQGQLPVELAESILEKTPEKKFFMANAEYTKMKEIVDILDRATEVEEEEDVEDSVASLEAGGEITEETDSAKFVVRVKAKGEGQTAAPAPVASDVKVTIRVKEPEAKE